MDATERQQWIDYAAGRTIELRNTLVERYLFLAQAIARKYDQRTPASVDYDELLSAAYLGLIDAVERFALDRGLAPPTFFAHRIHFAMADYLREIDEMTRIERKREKRVQQLATELQHEPTPEEIQEHCGFSFRPLRVASLSKDYENGDRLTTIGDTIADEHRAGSINEVATMLAGMNKQERLLIIMYYLEQYTMKEIGKQLGLSESRVSQMHSKLMVRLRANYDRHAA